MPRARTVIAKSLSLLTVLLFAVNVPAADADTVAEDEAMWLTFVEVDQLEYRVADGHDTLAWEAQAWMGGDYHKVWFKTRGEDVVNGGTMRAEAHLLYSRAITAFWDFQVGARYDAKPNPSRTYAVIGVQGLAPYFFEADAEAFVSNRGDVSARLEAEYELLITQRLIAGPSAELNIAAQDVEELGIGSGLSEIELGLRLRYEIVREVAPYVGVSWESKIGETADMARSQGTDVDDVAFVIGVRAWF